MTAMKLIKILELTACAGIAAFGVAAYLGAHASETIAIATIPFVLAGLVRDYSPRGSRWDPSRTTRFPSVRRNARSTHKLAA